MLRPEDIIDHLQEGQSPGLLVERISRRRLDFISASRSTFSFQIANGPDVGRQVSFHRNKFRLLIQEGLVYSPDPAELELEDEELFHLPGDDELAEIASLIAFHAVRNNTPLEDIHARGSISQQEMMALNVAVTDNIFTLLRCMRSPGAVERLKAMPVPPYWEAPRPNLDLKHDPSFDERDEIERERSARQEQIAAAFTPR